MWNKKNNRNNNKNVLKKLIFNSLKAQHLLSKNHYRQNQYPK